MKPEDIRKLLGGYATGTLTAAERDLLFAAALEDQTLFDTLANEEALRALLDDPAVRGELLATLDEKGAAKTDEEPRTYAAPLQAAAPRAKSAPEAAARNASPPWLTPRRIAFAGALAIAIFLIAGVVTFERRRIAPAEVAVNQSPQVLPQTQIPAGQITPAPAPSSNTETKNNAAGGVTGAQAVDAIEGRRDIPTPPPAPSQIASATSEKQRSGPETAEPFASAKPGTPAIDERQRSADAATNAFTDLSKDTERKAEQRAEQSTAASAVPPVRTAPAAAAPPPPTKKAEESDATSKREAAAGLVSGLVGKARSAQSASRLTATITDINATIITINAGTNVGLKNGDTLEIVRNGAVLGTVRLTDAHPTFSVGTLTRSQEAEPPRQGDLVRPRPPVVR